MELYINTTLEVTAKQYGRECTLLYKEHNLIYLDSFVVSFAVFLDVHTYMPPFDYTTK